MKLHLPHKGQTIKALLIIFVVLLLTEGVAVVWLLHSVGSYRAFWAAEATKQGDITYLALGDSAAQGIGASSPYRGYVGVVARRLAQKTGKTVRVFNLSVTGATLADYLKDQAPKIKDIKADYVTIEIGANDVLTFDEDKFRKEFTQVLGTLPPGTFVANMPLFNSRPGGAKKAKEASKVIAQLVADTPTMQLVDLQKQTTEHQNIFGFAPDLFHPNNISYKNWADAFWNKISETK